MKVEVCYCERETGLFNRKIQYCSMISTLTVLERLLQLCLIFYSKGTLPNYFLKKGGGD